MSASSGASARSSAMTRSAGLVSTTSFIASILLSPGSAPPCAHRRSGRPWSRPYWCQPGTAMLERTPQPAFHPDAVTAALGEGASGALREFTRALFARGAAEDLARYRLEDLGTLAAAAFGHLAERTAGEAKIRVWNP